MYVCMYYVYKYSACMHNDMYIYAVCTYACVLMTRPVAIHDSKFHALRLGV